MPEASAPTENQGPRSQEVEQTPRHRVEASLRKQQIITNVCVQMDATWLSRSPQDILAIENLRELLKQEKREFMELVSKLPEAEAWAEIEKENVRAGVEAEEQINKGRGYTSRDRDIASARTWAARNRQHETIENLERVREQGGASATASK